jgi:(p)ppGpp synthase/HD superfamily hydrolase
MLKSASLTPSLYNFANYLLQKSSRLSDGEREELMATLFASGEWHGNARRKSGHLYVIHPLQVACLLLDCGADCVTLQAALLHDVLEDTTVSREQLQLRFGAEVTHLVEGVTLSKHLSKRENLDKMYQRAAQDPRLANIKLADRIANLLHGSMLSLKQDSHLENLHETADWYLDRIAELPLAHTELVKLIHKAHSESEHDYKIRTTPSHVPATTTR